MLVKINKILIRAKWVSSWSIWQADQNGPKKQEEMGHSWVWRQPAISPAAEPAARTEAWPWAGQPAFPGLTPPPSRSPYSIIPDLKEVDTLHESRAFAFFSTSASRRRQVLPG